LIAGALGAVLSGAIAFAIMALLQLRTSDGQVSTRTLVFPLVVALVVGTFYFCAALFSAVWWARKEPGDSERS
jgi:hypothetical protein